MSVADELAESRKELEAELFEVEKSLADGRISDLLNEGNRKKIKERIAELRGTNNNNLWDRNKKELTEIEQYEIRELSRFFD